VPGMPGRTLPVAGCASLTEGVVYSRHGAVHSVRPDRHPASSAFATMREGIPSASAAKEGDGRAQRYPGPRDSVPSDLNR
jgi:hypothetical protein